jgi:hypothetical protein
MTTPLFAASYDRRRSLCRIPSVFLQLAGGCGESGKMSILRLPRSIGFKAARDEARFSFIRKGNASVGSHPSRAARRMTGALTCTCSRKEFQRCV